jgi:4-diphosphocytidyl-2-C-methyl-D-erythritol kinase
VSTRPPAPKRSTSTPGRVRATAYSKLTLSLRVLGARPDGFHEIEALAVSIGDPHDIIEARPVPHPAGVTFTVTGEATDVPEGPTNLALRAAEDLLLRAGRSGHGVRLNLRKKIPAGRGLGGGSADAAATLLAVRSLLEVDLDDTALGEIAAALGSDVPFCLTGGAAWMRGRGELVEPVDVAAGIPVLVVIPPFHVATPDVYRAWDDLGGPRSEHGVPAPGIVAALVPELANDLEPAAEAVEPGLVEFREALAEIVGVRPLLAGSGSAYAVLLPGAEHTQLVAYARRISRALRVPVATTSTVNRGVRLGMA